MSAATEYQITVWVDETSDPDDPKWIVSQDGNSSTTLDVFEIDEGEQARGRAEEIAAERGLKAYFCDQHGVETLITNLDDAT